MDASSLGTFMNFDLMASQTKSETQDSQTTQDSDAETLPLPGFADSSHTQSDGVGHASYLDSTVSSTIMRAAEKMLMSEANLLYPELEPESTGERQVAGCGFKIR